ncbi:hypothetical protein FRACYDRAFT_238672 [Fragilariopsis cylindrus CCMP1102]|uniref:Uncharacterized protein n=1 Tax=Fragilariopsis cylindrus CCMP1102 TaxID=635003 RepID=A0A1E7FDF8_9STRA|nr:hypothetical protein FRACYDRAFT_238672 [Fragilariopsis cylindrus CCMP1102]|eukprot:OEU16085.1 hypothetical protein FRACYDRAFT_238672 [Fragilariopsis cylindrus CCMP1102]
MCIQSTVNSLPIYNLPNFFSSSLMEIGDDTTMKMITRQRIICSFLAVIVIVDSVSPLLLLSSSRPSHISRRTELSYHTSFDPHEEPTTNTSNNTRRSMLQLMIVVGSGAVTSPAISAEIDPFAAMDEILSSEGIATGGSGTISSPGTSTTNTENESDDTTSKPANPSPIMNLDMEAALQESKKRRKIGPTTHG